MRASWLMKSIVGGFTAAGLIVACRGQETPPATSPPAVEEVTEDGSDVVVPTGTFMQPPEPGTMEIVDFTVTPEVDNLLDRLQQAGETLESFTGTMRYETADAFLGQKTVRIGEMIYEHSTEADDPKRFAIVLNSEIVGGVRRDNKSHYIFDGRWLAEVNHKDRQFILRELVAPGEVYDPLKLGEGPFPLPIGQPKLDVLSLFEVTEVSLPEEGSLRRVGKAFPKIDGLHLVPREGTPEAEDYTHVDVFFDRETRLPVGIEVIETNGDRKTVTFTKVKRNPELTEAQLTQLSIEEPDPALWQIDRRAWDAQ